MTNPITDMALPDAVVEKAWYAYHADPVQNVAGQSVDRMQSAIRAALQAMVDDGMATIVDEEHSVLNNKWTTRSIRIRLDADERKRKEQA